LPNQNAAVSFGVIVLKAIAPAVLAATVALGCAQVAPYERGRLAHPTMQPSDGASPGQAHVYAIHEGATGGAVSKGSGCGCN